MARYYANKNAQSDGYHEVHKSGCSHMPGDANRLFLGDFDNCKDAVKKSKETYSKSDGCYFCATACHTR